MYVGILGVVVFYFWCDVKMGFVGILFMLIGWLDMSGVWLVFYLVVVIILVVIFGVFLVVIGLNDVMCLMVVIGWMMFGFGLLLWWMD